MSKKKAKKPQAKPTDVNLREIAAIIELTQTESLSAGNYEKLKVAMAILAFLMEELRSQKASIYRLRNMLFGPSTEKTSQVLGKNKDSAKSESSEPKEKKPGHGRNGASAYTGANKIHVPHPDMHSGDSCPHCTGKVYLLGDKSPIIRITGMAPLFANVYERDQLRCNLCGELFTAPSPEGVGDKKYDESATSMVGMFKYGTGLPFNRIDKLQSGMGIPMPASTQWELVRDGAELLEPVHEEMINQAAQGKVIHNDDTVGKILGLTKEERAAAFSDSDDNRAERRTGVHTSGIVSTKDQHKIALFFTGVKHAGENLADVLARRNAELPAPIQMCDGLSRNIPSNFETVLSNCLAHARRNYVDIVDNFPEECRTVIEILRDVYKNDAIARERALLDEERLKLHQAESGPLMSKLEKWMQEQLDQHKVEPNSNLGDAIHYMQKRWKELTLFLRVPGAPLDNNICERAIKKVILHRKNALFYRTLNGAHVGDRFMSIIYTAELNGIPPFHYLVSLLRHSKEVAKAPAEWMPWNYQDSMKRLNLA
jgi:hypothetical protein